MVTVSGFFDRRHRAVRVDMASSGAVAQFADGITDAILNLFMRSGSVGVCMTTGTVRLVTRIRPVERLIIIGMAVQAADT